MWCRYRAAPDRLLEALYQYYRGGGYQTLQLQRLSNHAILLFMLMAVLWLVYGVPWHTLKTQHLCGSVWCVAGRMTFIGWCFAVIVGGCWLWATAQFWWVERPRWREAQLVMRHVLGVRDRHLQHTDFDVILERILAVKPPLIAETTDGGTKEMIVARMMRRENYMIALFNATGEKSTRLLDFGVPLSKPLEWGLSFVVIGFLFDTASFSIHPRFLSRHPHDREKLINDFQKRSVMTGIVILLLSPLIFTLTAAYVLFRYGEEIYRDTRSISQRQYSHRARWQFRDYNELPHYFDRRLAGTQRQANLLMEQFHDLKTAAVCRVIGFVAGTLLVMLLIVMMVNGDGDGNELLWWIGVLGAVVAVCRGQQGNPQHTDDPRRLIDSISLQLHCDDATVNTMSDRQFHAALSHWYPLKAKVVLSDLIGTITTPLALLLALPHHAAAIIDFCREQTVYVEGVGWACAMTRPDTGDTAMMDQKMRQSVMSFAARHHLTEDETEERVDAMRASVFYKQ